MKKIITCLFVILSFSGYSQIYWSYNINFEDSSQLFRLEIDTNSNPNNIWQIGDPQKTVFTSAYSLPNAIVTDLSTVYPDNDTSRFIIKHRAEDGFSAIHTVILNAKYQVNSDSLNDYGTIEFSPDNGSTWIDLLTDTVYQNQYCYEWWSQEPVLTGNSNGWNEFYVWLAGFGPVFNIQIGDTVIYRFSFISDNNQSNMDGLIYDNFHFEDWMEGINKLESDFSSKVYPNPAKESIIIEYNNIERTYHLLTLYDINGKSILLSKKTKNSEFNIEMNTFNSGVYYYILRNLLNNQISTGKIIKQ